jgi:integrase
VLIRTPCSPSITLVNSSTLLPRFWATVWASSLAVRGLKENTLKAQLRHIDALYEMCDRRYGPGALDIAFGANNIATVHSMAGDFYFSLTDSDSQTSSAADRWGAVKKFLRVIADQLAAGTGSWNGLTQYLESIGEIRRPAKGKFRFVRALPDMVLRELLQVAHPDSERNPFQDPKVRLRNWLILHLLLLCGLRRAEALLLVVDSLKHDVDANTGEVAYWLDVTTTEEKDDRATLPSIKTIDSHRQVPVSADLAALYEQYVSEVRVNGSEEVFLLTSSLGKALSAESVTKAFEEMTAALSEEAQKRFRERTGGKKHISPHDLRHTCATARYALFMAQDSNRDLTLQRLRAFFGWSSKSDMPELYARAAIQDDLLRSWNDLFDKHVAELRKQNK